MNVDNFNNRSLWNDCPYSLNHYVMERPSDDEIKRVEEAVGYILPSSYKELMKRHNGGLVKRNCCVLKETATWAPDHIIITGILGIGEDKTYSLCGTLGSRYMIEQCGYPDIGVYFCDTPAGDDEAIVLDYSMCGEHKEPQVVFIDRLFDYKKTVIAKDFQTFIDRLVFATSFETNDEEDEIDEESWIEETFVDEEV